MWNKSRKYGSTLLIMLMTSLFFASCGTGSSGQQRPRRRVKQFIREARVVNRSTIAVTFRLALARALQSPTQWKITPGLKVVSVKNQLAWGRPTARYTVKVSPKMKMGVNYKVRVGKLTPKFIDPDKLMDQLYSSKKLGMTEIGNSLMFRVFVPRADKVKLCLFKKSNLETPYEEIDMRKDKDAVWELRLPAKRGYYKQLYGYRIFGPEAKGNHFNSKIVIADPYSRATAQNNSFPQKSRTVILSPDYTTRYRWKSRKWTNLKTRDAIIYEVHIRDISMHPTAAVYPERIRGTYPGFIKKLSHIKDTVGMNAIELLPVHDVGNVEPPYRKAATMANGSQINNTWNPYAWNHWGYMNSSYFAVESMYATGYTRKQGAWNGVDGRQLKEFKQVVDACHQRGIAVILDVVYNHVSQYDYNPYKFIDYKYYFRSVVKSGCGNDFKTERPMARKMIIDSLKYFVQECHVDGFRFDLAGLIDHDTGVEIKKELTKVHPNVILIAEPWVGRYCPTEYSQMGWASWNDRYRNVVKGGDGNATGHGGAFIYGKSSGASLKPVIMGTLKKNGGLFYKMEHAINYLASHDNHSLGDHVRIDSGRIGAHDVIPGKDVDKMAVLTEREKKIHKLAALILYTSQGGVMILAGQEWAQAKVVHPPKPAVSRWANNKARPWTLDHDSYEKDNETNWLNFSHMRKNLDLVNYYKGLSDMRLKYRAFRRADESDVSWISSSDNYRAIGWAIRKGGQFIVLVNGSKNETATFKLPAGRWKVLVDERSATAGGSKSGTVIIPATSGLVLKK